MTHAGGSAEEGLGGHAHQLRQLVADARVVPDGLIAHGQLSLGSRAVETLAQAAADPISLEVELDGGRLG